MSVNAGRGAGEEVRGVALGDDLEMERRVTKLESDTVNHEKVCAARWGLLINLVGWGGALAVTVIIGIGGWSLNRLYEGQQQQNAALQQIIAHR